MGIFVHRLLVAVNVLLDVLLLAMIHVWMCYVLSTFIFDLIPFIFVFVVAEFFVIGNVVQVIISFTIIFNIV